MATERLTYCVMTWDCPGPSTLVDTCYGFTGGDKWQCATCESYVVTQACVAPLHPLPPPATVVYPTTAGPNPRSV